MDKLTAMQMDEVRSLIVPQSFGPWPTTARTAYANSVLDALDRAGYVIVTDPSRLSPETKMAIREALIHLGETLGVALK